VQGNGTKQVSFAKPKRAEFGLTNAGGIRQHRLEHWLQCSGRSGDDAQHLRGRGLLLKGFAQIGRALTQFVQQARVLDSNDGLLREIVHKLDLLVREGTDLLAVDRDNADQIIFLHHRHGK
jgi:hypothetical protein